MVGGITNFHLAVLNIGKRNLKNAEIVFRAVNVSLAAWNTPCTIDSYTVITWWRTVSEIWPPIAQDQPFMIGWSQYKLGLPRVAMHCGHTWPAGIPFFQRPLTVAMHSPNGGRGHPPNGMLMPAVRVVQWDCERVYIHNQNFLVRISHEVRSSRPKHDASFDWDFLWWSNCVNLILYFHS